MLTNANCTLYKYNGSGYTRYYIPLVYWRENKAGNVLKSGMQTADSTTIYLYDDKFVPENIAKDMLVKGVCKFDFDNTSQQTISDSMKSFRASHKFVTVTSVDNYFYGGNPHIEVSAK